MSRKTNAIRLIEQAGVDYEVRSYELSIEDFSAAAVAERIRMDAAAVFKTLVATGSGNGPCFAIVAGDAELDMKALARHAGERKMEMVPVRDLERLTGYRRGGVTALGARKALPVFLDRTAMTHATIGVSAGTKGLQVLLAPQDYVTLTAASVVELQRR
ncbi:MAG TPA: Cys-tRNA(Pro) deacylase [Acidimicrobiia bacterium]|jgi:Cys-tRNA(Pro)/Cys-tRNA(Cys) deacylase|nr:Cys-tRNA(Pro) deacylase [Acidimicrobiia bacterium]